MSRWKTTFESQQTFQQLQMALDQLENASVDNLAPEQLTEYLRLVKVLKVLLERLSIIDPELYHLNAWSNFPSWLQTIKSQVAGFVQSQNPSHLINANSAADEILNTFRFNDIGSRSEDLKALADASDTFQKKAIENLQNIRLDAAKVRGELDALSTATTSTKGRLDENDQVINQQKARLDQSISDFQRQFSEAQEKRTNDFAQALLKNNEEAAKQSKLFEARFNESECEWKNKYEVLRIDLKKESDEHLKFLETREDEVNRIFGAIGTSAFAGNFKSTAEKEAKTANVFRWIALGFMTMMTFVGGYAFYISVVHDSDWRLFLFRLGTMVVLGIPAFYAANESTNHRERERKNRKIHLELASIDAYLALLPQNEQNKIKEGLADKFFGVPDVKDKSEEVTKKDFFGLVSTVITNLTKNK